jgi:hypothetical protein
LEKPLLSPDAWLAGSMRYNELDRKCPGSLASREGLPEKGSVTGIKQQAILY